MITGSHLAQQIKLQELWNTEDWASQDCKLVHSL